MARVVMAVARMTQRWQLRKIVIALMLVGAVLVVAAPTQGGHTTTSKSCTVDHALTLVQQDTCAPGSITCPASHGICPFTITATISGTGVVAASVFQNAKACGPSLFSCSVTLHYNVSPGAASNPTCSMSATTTALDVEMLCTLSG